MNNKNNALFLAMQDKLELQTVFMRKFNDIKTAIFLSLIFAYKMKHNDDWIKSDNIEWELWGLTKEIKLRIQKRLVEEKYLKMKRKGIPPFNYYQINLDQVFRDL